MKIKPFAVEEWMNENEQNAVYNIAETCVDSLSLGALLDLCETDRESFLNGLCAPRLTYGDIEGSPILKKGISKLYQSVQPEEILTTHGAIGANHHVFYSLVEPGDRVVSVIPTYQQLYSIPEAFHADTQLIRLLPENGFLPDLNELRRKAIPGTKLICINNPNNPTGALMSSWMLKEIISIAKESGAYLLCDEVYRHLSQKDEWPESIADLYEKGISVGSMSKAFALAGLRLGWIATHDKSAMKQFVSHRDYNLISCGMLDEAIASLALQHSDQLLKRNKTIVRDNLAILDQWIRKEPHLSYLKPEAGTTALVSYDFHVPSYVFCSRLLKETGAFVTPGDCFEQPRSMRIGYACNQNVLQKGLAAISAFILKLEKEAQQND